MFRLRRPAWILFVVLGAVALSISCSGETPTDTGEEPVDQTPPFDALTHIISNPVSSPTAAASVSAAAEDTLSYVSLPPGAYPQGETATITNLANEAEVNATMVNGGFDPVPVPSAVGDTLLITIKNAEGETIGLERAPVPVDAPPLIVRTRPTMSKDFVPLNLVAAVVFSEPVDKSTVTALTIQIRLGGVDGVPVAGTVVLQANGFVAEFAPAAPLESGTEYALVVTTGIRDLAGDALPDQKVVSFETLGIVAYVVVHRTRPRTETERRSCCSLTIAQDQVAVIETKTHTVTKTIDLGDGSWSDITFIPNRPFAYLSGTDWDSRPVVAVLDAATHEGAGRVVGIEWNTSLMIPSEDGRFVYAGVNTWRGVEVISTDVHGVIAHLPFIDSVALPAGGVNTMWVPALAGSPDGSIVYVATQQYIHSTYSAIDTYFSMKVIDAATNSVAVTRRLPPVSRIRFSPDGEIAYASWVGRWDHERNMRASYGGLWADQDQSRIYVIDTADHDIVATIATDRRGEEMLMTPDGAYLLVSSPTMGDLTVIETATNSVIDRIGGMQSDVMLLTPDGSRLYAADGRANSVWVIDVASRSVVTGVAVDLTDQAHLAVTPDGAFVYVVNAALTVSVIDTETNTVVAEIDVGGTAKAIAITPR